MKLKALVAALALVSVGVANATAPAFADATQPGALSFTMWNAGVGTSSFFDLGLNSGNFTVANVGGAGCTVGCSIDKQITWNFVTGTVTSTGAADLSSLVAGVSGDWSAAWNAYKPAVAGSVYDVFAADKNSNATTGYHLLTTTSTGTAAATNAQLSAAINNTSNWNSANIAIGTHPTADNGADVVTSTGVQAYQGNATLLSMGSNYAGKAPNLTATGATNSTLDFWALDGVVGTSAALTTVVNYNGKFALDEAANTLTWTTLTAVPEASTYAMLLAGLGLMGLMARRRTS